MTNQYPPLLDSVLEHCPKAAFIYIKLWRNRGVHPKVSFSKTTIKDEYNISWKSFTTNLRILAYHHAITYRFDAFKENVLIEFLQPAEKIAC